jgi:hypothetical protein
MQPLLCYRRFSAFAVLFFCPGTEWDRAKADAERLLRQAVQTNKTGRLGNQAAADLLAIFLDQVTNFSRDTAATVAAAALSGSSGRM